MKNEGIAMTGDEQQRLTQNLGARYAMLLRNHGSLTVGRTIAEAFVLMETLDRATCSCAHRPPCCRCASRRKPYA